MVGDFFECVKMVELPLSPDGTYTFVTTATPAVDENPYEGSFVHVEYMVDCDGHCQPPSAPPSPPPFTQCEYGATPAGSGTGTNVSSTFTDVQHETPNGTISNGYLRDGSKCTPPLHRPWSFSRLRRRDQIVQR